MTQRKLKIWCDSGANHASRRTETVTFEELGVTPEEWDSMPEEEKDEIAKEVAFSRLDWGYDEV